MTKANLYFICDVISRQPQKRRPAALWAEQSAAV